MDFVSISIDIAILYIILIGIFSSSRVDYSNEYRQDYTLDLISKEQEKKRKALEAIEKEEFLKQKRAELEAERQRLAQIKSNAEKIKQERKQRDLEAQRLERIQKQARKGRARITEADRQAEQAMISDIISQIEQPSQARPAIQADSQALRNALPQVFW